MLAVFIARRYAMKSFFLFCLVFLLAGAFVAAGSGLNHSYGVSGDELPPLLQAAAKKSGVDPGKIVLLRPQDAEQFYSSHKLSVEKHNFTLGIHPDGGFVSMFVVDGYPIYVNGTASNPGEMPGFEIISAAYNTNPGAKFFEDIYAASLKHERAHAEGELRETAALLVEQQHLLSVYPKKSRPEPINVVLREIAYRYQTALKAEAASGPLGSHIHLARLTAGE